MLRNWLDFFPGQMCPFTCFLKFIGITIKQGSKHNRFFPFIFFFNSAVIVTKYVFLIMQQTLIT